MKKLCNLTVSRISRCWASETKRSNFHSKSNGRCYSVVREDFFSSERIKDDFWASVSWTSSILSSVNF